MTVIVGGAVRDQNTKNYSVFNFSIFVFSTLIFLLQSASSWAAIPNAPSGLSATPLSLNQIRIDWTDNSSDETSFVIEKRTGENGSFITLASVGTNVTTYTNSNLSSNTTYFYRIRAYNSSGYSLLSNETSATTFAVTAPSNLSLTSPNYTTAVLTWNDNYSGETGFSLERKSGSTGTYAVVASPSANATTYTNGGLSPGSVYYYRIRAYVYTGGVYYYSDYSNELTVVTQAIPAPSGLTATALSSNQVRLDWVDNSSDETSFYIERRTGPTGSFSQITNVGANATTYTNANLNQSTTYYYRVRAYNSNGYSAYSEEASAVTPPLIAPSNLQISVVSYTRIVLAWADNSNDEVGFYIERKTGVGGTYSQIASVGANVKTFTNTGLTQGTEYYYRVRAGNTPNYSDYTGEVGTTTLVLAAPSALTAAPLSSNQIKLTWTDNAPDENSYYVEYKTTGNYTALSPLGANVSTYTHTGLPQNTSYTYRVRAYNAVNSAYSAYSGESSATTLNLNAPSNLAATASYTSVSLTWTDNSSDESNFYVEKKTGAGGTYTQVGSVSANVSSYTNSGLTQGTEYYYRVRAGNSGNYSPYSAEIVATTPVLAAPSNLTATPLSSTQVKLTWTDNSPDETYFYIEYKTSGNFAVLIYVGTNVTTYTHSNLLQNTSYTYRVRAYNSSNNVYSLYSGEVNATTESLQAPSNLSVSGISYTQVTLTWTDNSSSEGFKIERKTGAGGAYSVISSPAANATTYTNTGLASGTQYYYRIRAYSGSNYSEYSNEVSLTTAVIPPPTDLVASPISSSQMKLTWADNSGDETRFVLERKKGQASTYSIIAYPSANSTTYTDAGLSQNTEFQYRIKAYSATYSLYSAYSNEVSASTLTLTAPSNVTAMPLSEKQIKIAWIDNSSDETEFSIEYKIGETGDYVVLSSVPTNITTYTHDNVFGDATYYYRVRAYNGYEYSSYSNTADATTPSCVQEGFYQP